MSATPTTVRLARFDLARTARLYRIIATNDRSGLQDLARELARLGGVISAPTSIKASIFCHADRHVYDSLEHLVDVTESLLMFALTSEALDRGDVWAQWGVWLPDEA